MRFYNGTPKCCMLVASHKYHAIISKVIYVTAISWLRRWKANWSRHGQYLPRMFCCGKRQLHKRQWNNFEPQHI
jgi:hypothetical protein